MSTRPDPWSREAFDTSILNNDYDQFLSLRLASDVTSGMSLAACIMIFLVYIYMLLYHRNEANRVSLRVVFVCSFFEILIALMNILMADVSASTRFCSVAELIVEFSNVTSAALLTMVGFNLVLIFVINVSRRDLLERFYYPAVVLYAFTGIAMSIRDQVVLDDSQEYLLLSCWYVTYIEDRNYSGMSWMWFYGFIFFVNVVAILCSVLALVKLIKELRVVAAKLQHGNDHSSIVDRTTENQMNKSIKKRQSGVFTKVVLRCIIYPLVPFLVNIFGLINQMNMSINNVIPSYAMTMLDIIFASLEGFLVAIVFFTDPAITSLIKKNYRTSVQKYVQEYTKVTQEEADKNNDMITAPTSSTNTNRSNTAYNPNPNLNPTITLPNAAGLGPHDANIYDISRASDDDRSIRQLQLKRGTYSTKLVAMRKVQVEVTRQITHSRKNSGSSGGSTRHQKHNSLASSSLSSAHVASPEAAVIKSYNAPTPTGSQQSHSQTSFSTVLKDMYLPYKSPFMATFYHFILTVICRVKKQPGNYLPPNTERDTFCVQEEEEYEMDEDYYEEDLPGSSRFNHTGDDDSEKIDIYTRAAQRRKRKTIASTQHF